MDISRASPEDAYAIAKIHVDSWREAYRTILPAEYLAALSVEKRQTFWTQSIAEGKSELWLAKADGVIQGWISFGKSRDDDLGAADAEIWALYVAPPFWSKGIGLQLWLKAKDFLSSQGFSSCSLWVLSENVRAIRFYETVGFKLGINSSKSIALAGIQLTELRYVISLEGMTLVA